MNSLNKKKITRKSINVFDLHVNNKNKRRNSNSQLETNLGRETDEDDLIIKYLLSTPDKKDLLISLLKKSAGALKKKSEKRLLENKFHVESPTSVFRRRALLKVNSNKDNFEVDEFIPPEIRPPFHQLLEGVVAYVEIKCGNEDRSSGAKKLMEAMGATVKEKFTRDVTHVIFKDGCFNTFNRAKLYKIHIVSVLWLDAIKTTGIKVPEKKFPPLASSTLNPNLSKICQDFEREYSDVLHEELEKTLVLNSENTSSDSSQNRNEERHSNDKNEDEIVNNSSDSDINSDCGLIDGHTSKRDSSDLTFLNETIEDSVKGKNSTSTTESKSLLSSHSKLEGKKLSLSVENSHNDESANFISGEMSSLRVSSEENLSKENEKTSTSNNANVITPKNKNKRRLFDPNKTILLKEIDSEEERLELQKKLMEAEKKKEEKQQKLNEHLIVSKKIDKYLELRETLGIDVNQMGLRRKVTNQELDALINCLNSQAASKNSMQKTVLKRKQSLVDIMSESSENKSENENSPEEIANKAAKNLTQKSPIKSTNQSREEISSESCETESEKEITSEINPSKTKSTFKNLTQRSPMKRSIQSQKKILNESSENESEKENTREERPKKMNTLSKTQQELIRRRTRHFSGKKLTQVVKASQKPTSPRRSSDDFMKIKFLSHKKNKNSDNNKKKKIIVCTRLHRPRYETFTEIVEKLGGFTIEEDVSKKTTHLIVGEPIRTVNLLRAMARGCWILRYEWFNKSLEAGKWLNEEDFELTEFSPAVRQCRKEKQAFGSSFSIDVFQNVGPIYVAKVTELRQKDLKELIKLCKGTITNNIGCAKVVVGEKRENAVCVSVNWVLDSIEQKKKKRVKNYLLTELNRLSENV